PTDPEALEAMLPYFTRQFGNASTLYSLGQEAHEAIENARSQVAALLGARADEIYFTSGATEADNWAIFGMAAAQERKGKHLISSVTEHEAVLQPLHALEKRGWEVTLLPVDGEGRVNPEDVENAIRHDTVLISIMHSNNEIGVIQPLPEIGALARERRIPFHTDAVQSIGKVPVDVAELGCDLLSLSGHKIYGPKGVGALYVRKGIRIRPFMEGGGQEENKRSGTYNVPGIVGLGKALEVAGREIEADAARWTRWRDRIIDAVLAMPDTRLNGSHQHRLPMNVNVSFLGTEGEPMLLNLDERGFCVSSGAACSSGSTEPSHVLTALGLSREWAQGSLRFSLGRTNTDEQIGRLLEVLPEVVGDLRRLNPGYGTIGKVASPVAAG
ncbi:MAG: IscS subfamily cysteine desulfurase, partial [Armatimonadetes bacterium]|nr:IscS subfamily cysteine desulfurase [Armatimonadota bacterium]